MGYKLITQIILIATSLVIVAVFIRPSFSELKAAQDELFQYKDTVEKASVFNDKLREIIQKEASFSRRDMQALETFLPSKIDSIMVMRDIQRVFDINRIEIESLKAADMQLTASDVVLDGEEVVTDQQAVNYQEFEVVFTARYDVMKNILRTLEANEYILEVVAMDFNAAPAPSGSQIAQQAGINTDGEIAFTMILRTYGLSGLSK